jgi:hypothetical protein
MVNFTEGMDPMVIFEKLCCFEYKISFSYLTGRWIKRGGIVISDISRRPTAALFFTQPVHIVLVLPS